MKGRWKVACINWGNRDGAPKAIAYMLTVPGWVRYERYFPTHAEAITFAQQQARNALAASLTMAPEMEGAP